MRTTYLLLFSILVHISIAQQSDFQQAKTMYEMNEYEKSISLLETMPQNNAEVLLLMGKNFLKLKQYAEAIDHLEQSIEINDNSAEGFYWLGTANIDALQNSDNFFKKGIYAFEAQKALQTTLKINPSHVNARIKLCNYYLNAPMIAGGSISKAKEHANILKQYDQNKGILLLASVHLKNGTNELAAKTYKQLLEMDTIPEKTYYLISNTYLKDKQFKQAFHYCELSLHQFPEYKTAYYQFAKIAVESHSNLDKAIGLIEFFISSNTTDYFPKLHWAYLRYGELLVIQSKKEAAKAAFKKALEIKPDFEQANNAYKQLTNR